MRTMHLFAGAGGGLLADLIVGNDPVCAVEIDPFCCKVLRERAAEGWFPNLHVHEGDIRLFDPSDWKGRVDCIHAGFPCQDISSANPSGRGIDGERSGLVWEVFRAIDAIRPRFVFLENSPRIRTKGRDRIIAALVARGYAWRDGTLAASDVGAWHQRERWWLFAANADGLRELQQERGQQELRGRVDNGAEETPCPAPSGNGMDDSQKHIRDMSMKWITLKRYCEITGETPNAVHKRRRRGVWLDGVHCQVRERKLWVNLEAVQEWVENGMKTPAPKARRSDA